MEAYRLIGLSTSVMQAPSLDSIKLHYPRQPHLTLLHFFPVPPTFFTSPLIQFPLFSLKSYSTLLLSANDFATPPSMTLQMQRFAHTTSKAGARGGFPHPVKPKQSWSENA